MRRPPAVEVGEKRGDISGVQLNTERCISTCTASGKRPQPYQPRVVVSDVVWQAIQERVEHSGRASAGK